MPTKALTAATHIEARASIANAPPNPSRLRARAHSCSRSLTAATLQWAWFVARRRCVFHRQSDGCWACSILDQIAPVVAICPGCSHPGYGLLRIHRRLQFGQQLFRASGSQMALSGEFRHLSTFANNPRKRPLCCRSRVKAVPTISPPFQCRST